MSQWLQKLVDNFKSTKWCPQCQTRGLECYHAQPGYRGYPRQIEARSFYRCNHCQARYVHYPDVGRWEEAEGEDYDSFYSIGTLEAQKSQLRSKHARIADERQRGRHEDNELRRPE